MLIKILNQQHYDVICKTWFYISLNYVKFDFAFIPHEL
jgi:hypothetical protein